MPLTATSRISRLSHFASGMSRLVASNLLLRSLCRYWLVHHLVCSLLTLTSFVLVGVFYALSHVADNVGATTRRLVTQAWILKVDRLRWLELLFLLLQKFHTLLVERRRRCENFALHAFTVCRYCLWGPFQQMQSIAFVFCVQKEPEKGSYQESKVHLREIKGSAFNFFHQSSEISIEFLFSPSFWAVMRKLVAC